jgi:hypothetical protein
VIPDPGGGGLAPERAWFWQFGQDRGAKTLPTPQSCAAPRSCAQACGHYGTPAAIPRPPEDLPLLVRHLLSRAAWECGKALLTIDPKSSGMSYRYVWTGNLCELGSAQPGIPPRLRVAFFPVLPARAELLGILLLVRDLLPPAS